MLGIFSVARRQKKRGQPTSNDNASKKNELEPDDIGIAGIRQLMDPSYSLCEKCFWLIALLLCCVVCFYQAITLTVYYLSNPISIEMQMLRNDTITFPAVTICPASLSYDFANALEFFRRNQCWRHNFDDENCTMQTLNCVLNITMENLWQQHKVLPENFEINSTCATRSTNGNSLCDHGRKKYDMLHKFVPTIFGTCLYAAQRAPMEYKGPDTYISFKTTDMFPLTGPYKHYSHYTYSIDQLLPRPPNKYYIDADNIIRCTNCNLNDHQYNEQNYPREKSSTHSTPYPINGDLNEKIIVHLPQASDQDSYDSSFSSEDETWKEAIPFSIFLHEPHVISRHDTSYLAESIFRKYYTELKISVKEYRYLNTKENPCTDEETYTECRNKCLDEKLQQEIPCKFPFIKGSNKPECLNSTETLKEAYEKAMNFYRTMKLSDCSCARKCNDIVYTVMSDVGFRPPDEKTTFHLYYPINIHEVVIENFTYSLENLLTDIAGAIGFYMGVCILGFVEIFDIIIKKKVRSYFHKTTEDVELKVQNSKLITDVEIP